MIQAEDLSKCFGDFWAVDGICFSVQPGQVLVFLGPNGAGKTTTIRMLTSVLRPTRGWARIAGYDVAQQPEKVRSVVGVLTEQHGLYLRMTAEEYLEYFGQIYGLDASVRSRRIRHLLDYFNLAGVARQRIGEYSKGMRQKLALARTLIHEPPVLLLDEPTSAMDPESARLVRDSITSLRSEHRTIIICTHNLAEAELLADQIAIICRGRILISGKMEKLKKHLLGPAEYEVQIRGKWPKSALHLPPGVVQVGIGQTGMRFRIADPQRANPVLVRELVARKIEVIKVQEIPQTLEQVYLQAMRQAIQD